MKKLFSIFAAMLVALVANAAVININTGTSDALRKALSSAASGDVIVMAAGTYVESNSDYIAFTGKNVTVMAEEGAEVILVPKVPVRLKSGARAEFINIKFDCGHLSDLGSYSEIIVPADGTVNKKVILNGCEFYGWKQKSNAIIHTRSDRQLDSIVINDCYFHDNLYNCVSLKYASVDLVISNSTFANITTDASAPSLGVIDVQSTTGSVLIDHCTFYNCQTKNTDYGAIKIPNAIAPVVSNSIFMMPEAYEGGRAVYNAGGEVKNCLTYNYTKDDNTGIHGGPTITACIQGDPLFRDAANADFHLGDGSPALAAAEDGGAIGPIRWVPTMDYYLVGSMTEWKPLEAYKLAQNPENEDEFILPATLYAGDAFKIAKSDGATISDASWYPGGVGNDYIVTASGEYTVYFRPDGQGGEGWYEGFFRIELKDLGPWEAIFFDEELNPNYDSYITYDATMGKVVVYIRKEHYPSSTIVQYAWGLPEDGKCYRVAMKMKANRDIAGVSLIWMNGNKMLLEENETISLPANEVFVYDAICTGMADPANEQASNLIFGFKTVHPDDEIEIYDVVIEEADCPEPPTFYLAGDMTEWTLLDDYQFAASETTEDEYVLDTYLPVGAAIRVAGIQDGNETWYPNGIAGAYIVDAAHAGWVTVYFRPAGNPEWAAFGGYMFIDVREGLDKVEMTPQNAKFFRDGQLFILKDGRIYNVIGQKIAQ